MTRVTIVALSSLAAAAVLSMATAGPSQGRAEDFQVWQKNLGSLSSKGSGKPRQPKTLAGKQQRQQKAWPSKIELPPLMKKRR